MKTIEKLEAILCNPDGVVCIDGTDEDKKTLTEAISEVGVLEGENKRLRKMLWLRHGCTGPALYGDDGELQCNKCMIDFKRLPVWKIEDRFCTIAMEKLQEEGK